METITIRQKEGWAEVTLNRPDAMNAFNYQMLTELGQAAESLRINPDVRAVVIKGSGDKAFSVGADLKERKTLTEQQVKRNINKIGEVFSAIEAMPQPVIAAMNGYAFGGGMELALACDFRIAEKDTLMGLTETSLAIIPGAGGTQRLPRIVGEAKALELILTAKRFTAEEGAGYGLITKAVEKGELDSEVSALLNAMLANGPIALQQAKYAIKTGMKADLQTGLQIERKAYEITIPTEDRVEALIAFSEKRKPVFKGK
ncbi:enoyl-CoA hydratase-related protein [Jeotgalibacillus sp. R-1-5s-1]|uniref:enoyl-CoA hydratase-related protein n=1 Tax=Jeotgalibacillus sp. R-1-5s-1 TaxID=2555897 RepID=UPI00106D08AC|nr:enoyl-CoA hydratase-related protein [Jeotgalibacillus sp. R-1-5s-1]TFD97644.1 enoyl-CoA hydratase [Jeotgalibacillus sp. R-1-5s-1]